MYGYEVKKRLDERLGHTWKFSYGSLYPTLKKLSKVEAVEMEFPDGETLTRKKKIVYRITPVPFVEGPHRGHLQDCQKRCHQLSPLPRGMPRRRLGWARKASSPKPKC